MSPITSPASAQEGLKGCFDRDQSPTGAYSEKVSPSHTLIHSSPELPPLPSFTYLQNHPQTPKANSVQRQARPAQYYISSWGSPYSHPPSSLQDQVDRLGYDEASNSDGDLDSESPDLRFSLAHLLPLRNLNLPFSASGAYTALDSNPGNLEHNLVDTFGIRTTITDRRQYLSDELRGSASPKPSDRTRSDFWVDCATSRQQLFSSEEHLSRLDKSTEEARSTSSDSTTPIKVQSNQRDSCNEGQRKWSGRHLGHKSRKDNLTLRPENLIRLTEGDSRNTFGTMLQSKYADPAFAGKQHDSGECQNKNLDIGMSNSSKDSKGSEAGLHGLTQSNFDSSHEKKSSNVDEQVALSSKRTRKKISSRGGKTYVVHLPAFQPDKARPQVQFSGIDDISDAGKNSKRQRVGTQIVEKTSCIPRDCEICSQNREIFPDPAEDARTSAERRYPVRIPDHSKWEQYVNELREQKLKALGVSTDDEKTTTSMSRQSSSQNPVSTRTSPLLAHFAGRQLSRSSISHVASPSLVSSSPNPFASKSTTSPIPGFGKVSSLTQSPRSVSPFSSSFGFYIPPRQSPSNLGWPPQPDVKQSSTLYNNSSTPAANAMNMGDIRPSVMPYEVSGLNGSQSGEIITLRQQQTQQQHIPITRPRSTLESVPESAKEDAISPKTVAAQPTEIVVPTPHGHRHNISASLEKDILDAEYHLEKAIDRQLGEGGEFDSGPARSDVALKSQGSDKLHSKIGMSKKKWPSAQNKADMQHEQRHAEAQILKDAKPSELTAAELLHFMDKKRRPFDSEVKFRGDLAKGQYQEIMLGPDERHATSPHLSAKSKWSHVSIEESRKTSEDNVSKKNTTHDVAHESKSPFSTLNAGAQEFSLSSKTTSNASPFSVSDFAIRQDRAKQFTSTKQMLRTGPKRATFNVTAPNFTPGNSGFGLEFPTKDFSFLSGGPPFKPDALEFVPQTVSKNTSSGITKNETLSISHDGSDLIFPSFDHDNRSNARRSKAAVPIKLGHVPETQADQEDEDGRITRASDKQKRARHNMKDGDDIPRFALHPQRLSGTARIQPEKAVQANSVYQLENKENVAPQNVMNDEPYVSPAHESHTLASGSSISRASELSKDKIGNSLKEDKESNSDVMRKRHVDGSSSQDFTSSNVTNFGEITKKENKTLETAIIDVGAKSDSSTRSRAEDNKSSSSDRNDGAASNSEDRSQHVQTNNATRRSVTTHTATGDNTSGDTPVVSQTTGIDFIEESVQEAESAHLTKGGSALIEDSKLRHPSSHANQESHPSRPNGRSLFGESDQGPLSFSKPNRNDTSSSDPHQLTFQPQILHESSLDELPSSSPKAEKSLKQISSKQDTKNPENIVFSLSNDKFPTGSEGTSTTGREVVEDVVDVANDVLMDTQNNPPEHDPYNVQKSVCEEDANKTSHIGSMNFRKGDLDSDADDEDDELHASPDYRKRRPMQDYRSEGIKSIIAEAITSQRDIFAAMNPQRDLEVDITKVLDRIDELKTDIKRLDLPGQMNGSILSGSVIESQDDQGTDSLTTAVNSILLSVAELKAERDLNVQVSKLKEQLKEALMRADCANDAKADAERQLTETQQSLGQAKAENILLRASPNNSVHDRTSRDETPCDSCSGSSQSTTSEREDDNLQNEVHRLTAEVDALSSTLEEYRVSSTQWRSDIDQTHKDNEMLKSTMSSLRSQLEDALRVRDAMQSKLETLQGNLLKAVGQAANEKAYWQRMDQESRNKLELFSVKYDTVSRLKEKLEQQIGYLEGEEREAVRLRIMYEQSQKANSSSNEMINYLRTENAKLEALVAHSESVAKEAKENGHAEAQRLKILLNAEIEVAKSQTDAVRAESQSRISNLESELRELTERSEIARAKYEDQLQKQAESEIAAVRDALQMKDAALRDNSRVHEESVTNLQSHHQHVLDQMMEDKQQSEVHFNAKLCLAREEVDHLRDKINYLKEKLEVSDSAAHAAALAAKSAKTAPLDQQPEKVPAKALRETIQALQEQLQEKEQRIEHLETQVSSFDTEAPSKLKEREAEVGWLRELFSVRIDDLSDLVSTLSQPEYDREVVRDAAIRIRASLQMEQQERERLMAGDRPFPSFPNVATISNFASPKAAQLAAAIGNWRKGKETARLFQRPQSASSSKSVTPVRMSAQPQGFLSGLMTPPASNVRRTPDIESSTPRRRAASRLNNATDLLTMEPRLYEKHPTPVTPPLLGQRSYDDDAESGQFSISRFQDDDTTSMISARYDEEEREIFNRGLQRESEAMHCG